ncbi:UNVERIFIED_CONTAM: hypothetical protein Sangu_2279600 [Sesamum angustifolium]|uniref:Protein kinase domain-containing protein n=1 Tax=Sesamum angustifolium TaxID=2727405 RepID=A0AAW2L700_9LAMI
MEEEERNKLGIILNATLRVSNVGKVFGFWCNEDDKCVYMVFEKIASPNLVKCVLKKKEDKDERLSSDEISALAMLCMEICEILSRLHSEGLVFGFLRVSCFGFNDFGHVYVDLGEVLNTGFKFDWGKSRYEVGCASDVWFLACLLVRLIVGSTFVEEMERFLHFVVNAIKEEKGCDYSGLCVRWSEKIAVLLEGRLASEYASLQDILYRCLGFDPGNRPVITDLWKCLRELVVKPQFDTGLMLKQEVKKE